MLGGMIVLHVEPRWISPYVFSCFVTLEEKRVPYEVAVLDSARDETKAPSHLARTTTGRVPALVHDDFGLAESSAIVEYLDEVFPGVPVLPRDPQQRARARQLMSWMRSDDTAPIREERPTTTIFYAPTKAPLSAAGLAAATKLCAVAERVIGEPNLFGAWSIVDAELAFILHRLLANGDPVPPPVKAWAEAQWARPSVRAWLARPRPPLTAPRA
jgi:glutathione S-transferase